jgi:hypothetical protein
MRDGLWGLSEGATDLIMAAIGIIAIAASMAWILWSMAAL